MGFSFENLEHNVLLKPWEYTGKLHLTIRLYFKYYAPGCIIIVGSTHSPFAYCMGFTFTECQLRLAIGLRTRNIYVLWLIIPSDPPHNISLWKPQPQRIIAIHGNKQENPRPTIRPDLKYYAPRFKFIVRSTTSHCDLCICHGLFQLWLR